MSSPAPGASSPPPAEAGFHPVVRGYDYAVEFGPYSLRVDPDDGGRIVSFALDGRNVILPRSESPEAYASSFWTSPQSDWSWPPPLELDKLPWRASIEGSSLVLESGTSPKLGLSARQRIAPDPARGSVVIELTLTNRSAEARRVAPWQNTRVRPRGLTFFPSKGPTLPESAFALAPIDGVIWFAHDPAAVQQSGKLFADGEEGWLAHVDGDLLFIKMFPEVPREAQAPKEAEIEIYVHDSGRFVEVEQQGAYESLAPGASSVWPLRWLVRRLPATIKVQPGSADLARFARALVAAAR